MSGRRTPQATSDGNQERLFLVPPSQEFIPNTQEGLSVGIEQRAFFLVESLNELEKAQDIRERVKTGWPEQRYGKVHASNLAKQASQHERNSRKSFSDARGTDQLIALAGDEAEVVEIRAEDSKDYLKFIWGYGSEELNNPDRYPRKKLRTTIRTELARFVQWSAFTTTPDSKTSSPRQKDKVAQKTNDESRENKGNTMDALTDQEKLQTIAEDERAGFIPTTNLEKSLVLTYLSYLDNPDEFPLGPMNQLLEVVCFHIKHAHGRAGIERGAAAARRVTHIFGDFLDQASAQLVQLQRVNVLLADTANPNISIAVALNSEMVDAVPLVRFMDLTAMMHGNRTDFSTMLTRHNVKIIDGRELEIIEDPYTGERSKKVVNYLKRRMMKLNVGDTRGIVEEAILDQTKRIAFHNRVLEELGEAPAVNTIVQKVSEVARSRVR